MKNSTLIGQLVNYKAWATQGIFAALEKGRSAMMEDFPIVIAILDHALAVDCIFKAHLTGASHSYTSANSTCPQEFSDMARTVSELDQWYIDYVSSLSDDELTQKLEFQFTNGETATLSRAEMLLHVVNHGTYHRGNIGIIMQKNGVAPNKDVLTNFLLNPAS